jgi:hypothetical protein
LEVKEDQPRPWKDDESPEAVALKTVGKEIRKILINFEGIRKNEKEIKQIVESDGEITSETGQKAGKKAGKAVIDAADTILIVIRVTVTHNKIDCESHNEQIGQESPEQHLRSDQEVFKKPSTRSSIVIPFESPAKHVRRYLDNDLGSSDCRDLPKSIRRPLTFSESTEASHHIDGCARSINVSESTEASHHIVST